MEMSRQRISWNGAVDKEQDEEESLGRLKYIHSLRSTLFFVTLSRYKKQEGILTHSLKNFLSYVFDADSTQTSHRISSILFQTL